MMMLWQIFITSWCVDFCREALGQKFQEVFGFMVVGVLSPGGYTASTVGANFSLVTAVVVLYVLRLCVR